MSDNENTEYFEGGESGNSNTFPSQAHIIRKNGHIVIDGRPCKVVDMTTSKTGKHGHAKVHFVAVDIFNGKKMEDLVPSSHNVEVPILERNEYELLNIEDGHVSLLLPDGTSRSDIPLPYDEDVCKQLLDRFENGPVTMVTVLKAMGEEQIVSMKDAAPRQ